MRFRVLSACLALSIGWAINFSARAEEVLGEIVGSSEQVVYVQFPSTVNPPSDQVLNVVWLPDGSRIDVGKVRVVSSDDGFVTASLVDGQASIGMKVAYHHTQTTPVQRNIPKQTQQPKPQPTPTIEERTISPESDDDEIGEELDIDTTWAYSMVNAELWEDQSFLAKSQAVSRYSRALASALGKSQEAQENSLRLYLKSAQKGHRLAQYKVGWMLENGLGTEKNLTLALAWYQIAAAKGHKKAALGMARLEGN